LLTSTLAEATRSLSCTPTCSENKTLPHVSSRQRLVVRFTVDISYNLWCFSLELGHVIPLQRSFVLPGNYSCFSHVFVTRLVLKVIFLRFESIHSNARESPRSIVFISWESVKHICELKINVLNLNWLTQKDLPLSFCSLSESDAHVKIVRS